MLFSLIWPTRRRKGTLRTLRTAELGSGRPDRAEAAFGHSLIEASEIVARQADVLLAERRDVLEQVSKAVSTAWDFPSKVTARSRSTVFHSVMPATTRLRPLARYC